MPFTQSMTFYNEKASPFLQTKQVTIFGNNNTVITCNPPLLLRDMSFFKAYKTAKEEGYILISYTKETIKDRKYLIKGVSK